MEELRPLFQHTFPPPSILLLPLLSRQIYGFGMFTTVTGSIGREISRSKPLYRCPDDLDDFKGHSGIYFAKACLQTVLQRPNQSCETLQRRVKMTLEGKRVSFPGKVV